MPRSLSGLSPSKILIRSTNWIGDAIMTTPAIHTIRRNFPQARISILAKPWVAGVFAASPDVDDIIVYKNDEEHRGVGGLFPLARELRQQGFDLAILLQNAFEAALIARLAAIPLRAGFSRDGRGLLLTHGITLPLNIKRRHQVYYYQTLMAKLGLTPGPNDLSLQLPQAARLKASDLLSGLGKGPFIGLNPGGAYGPAKRWPTQNFAALTRRLHKELNAWVLVFGTTAEAGTGAAIQAAAPGAVLDLTGRTDLIDAMALIERCHAFVSNDSGLMHVGAALKTPMAAIFGSTNPVTTGPFSKKAIILRKDISCSPCLRPHCDSDFRCMTEIVVDDVFSAVTRLLF